MILSLLATAVPAGFNRDPHFQRVMVVDVYQAREARRGCFNRDPHFQRVMAVAKDSRPPTISPASIGTLIFRG